MPVTKNPHPDPLVSERNTHLFQLIEKGLCQSEAVARELFRKKRVVFMIVRTEPRRLTDDLLIIFFLNVII
jgi:hypothetical protein